MAKQIENNDDIKLDDLTLETCADELTGDSKLIKEAFDVITDRYLSKLMAIEDEKLKLMEAMSESSWSQLDDLVNLNYKRNKILKVYKDYSENLELAINLIMD